ncbi:MAG: hypothetical protein P8163_14815 [Candidatus Thiodiazotropha sp.]
MKRLIFFALSSLLVLTISTQASAHTKTIDSSPMAMTPFYPSFVDAKRTTSAPVQLAGKTKTKVKEKSKTRTVDEDGNVTVTKIKKKTTTTTSSDDTGDDSNQSSGSGGSGGGVSYEGY